MEHQFSFPVNMVFTAYKPESNWRFMAIFGIALKYAVISTQPTISCFAVFINCSLDWLAILFFPALGFLFPMRQIRSADQFIENRKSSTLFDSISRGIIAFKATFATLFSISMNRNTGAGIYSMIIWFFASTFFFISIRIQSWFEYLWIRESFDWISGPVIQTHLIPVTVSIARNSIKVSIKWN